MAYYLTTNIKYITNPFLKQGTLKTDHLAFSIGIGDDLVDRLVIEAY